MLSIMQLNYPDSFKGKTDETVIATISLWAKMFADDRAEDVYAAVMAHMATDTNRFMPPMGVIKDKLVKMRSPEEMTELEAWGYVNQATKNSTHNSVEEFEKLPPIIQRLVGSPNQLKEWAVMDAETVQSVVASNFQRSFKARAKNEREYMALPDGIKKAAAQIGGGLKMLGEGAES